MQFTIKKLLERAFPVEELLNAFHFFSGMTLLVQLQNRIEPNTSMEMTVKLLKINSYKFESIQI